MKLCGSGWSVAVRFAKAWAYVRLTSASGKVRTLQEHKLFAACSQPDVEKTFAKPHMTAAGVTMAANR